MNAALIGLAIVAMGIYFNSFPAIGIGLLCTLMVLYEGKARPVKVQKEEMKTKHTVIMSEAPEYPMAPWDTGEFPAEGLDQQNYIPMPMPQYGYSDPLEKILFGLPLKFWRK